MNDVSTVTVTRETLESTVPRSVTLLRAIARNGPIRARLLWRGYSQAEHDRGLKLVAAVCAYQPPTAANDDEAVRSAMAELNQTDEDFITVVDATFRHNFPAVAERLLGGIHASADEGEAFAMMSVLLGRLAELDQSRNEEERQAIALLNTRIGPSERARLTALVQTASRIHAEQQPDEQARQAADDQYVADLTRLRAWYEEWSKIARATIKRRDLLIRLGLAHPRRQEVAEDQPDEQVAAGAPAPIEPQPQTL